MFDRAQLTYLEEVLGVSGAYFLSQPQTEVPEVVVWTRSADAEHLLLLEKILSAVHLHSGQFLHVQGDEPDRVPSARHVLIFNGDSEREVEEQTCYWHLPRLSEMSGAGAGVAENKRRAWSVLQQFGKDKTSLKT